MSYPAPGHFFIRNWSVAACALILAGGRSLAAQQPIALQPGERTLFKVEAVPDSVTSRMVERISPAGCDAYLPYYTREVITPDNRGVLISLKIGENWFPFISYPDEGFVVCLSDQPLYTEYNPALAGERVIFVDKRSRLGWAPITGGEFHAVSHIPGDNVCEVAPSADGRFCAIIYRTGYHRETVQSLIDGQYHSRLSELMAMQPGYCLVYIDLDTGRSKGLIGDSAYGMFAHPMISPANPNILEYCSAQNWRRDVRMRSLRYYPEALGHAEPGIPYAQKVPLESVGHEAFLQDGRLAAIWMRYDATGQPDQRPSETGILITDPVSKDFTLHKSPGMIWNHLHGRDGKTFVSEGASSHQCTVEQRAKLPPPPVENWQSEGRDLLSLYEIEGDKVRTMPLCWLGVSWQGQRGHAHPVIARDNSYAVFNRDSPKGVAVYRVGAKPGP